MLEQRARVVASSTGVVWIEPVATGDCGACAGKGCAGRQVAERFGQGPRRYRVESSVSVSVGDHVLVGMPDGRLILSAFYLYGLPLILILAGALAGQAISAGELSAVLGAAAGGLIAASLHVFHPSRFDVGSSRVQYPLIVRRE